jgi:hypothetical protein
MRGFQNIPSNVRSAFEVLRERIQPKTDGAVDVEWARRIVARKEAGHTVSQAALDMAREALAKNGGAR